MDRKERNRVTKSIQEYKGKFKYECSFLRPSMCGNNVITLFKRLPVEFLKKFQIGELILSCSESPLVHVLQIGLDFFLRFDYHGNVLFPWRCVVAMVMCCYLGNVLLPWIGASSLHIQSPAIKCMHTITFRWW